MRLPTTDMVRSHPSVRPPPAVDGEDDNASAATRCNKERADRGHSPPPSAPWDVSGDEDPSDVRVDWLGNGCTGKVVLEGKIDGCGAWLLAYRAVVSHAKNKTLCTAIVTATATAAAAQRQAMQSSNAKNMATTNIGNDYNYTTNAANGQLRPSCPRSTLGRFPLTLWTRKNKRLLPLRKTIGDAARQAQQRLQQKRRSHGSQSARTIGLRTVAAMVVVVVRGRVGAVCELRG